MLDYEEKKHAVQDSIDLMLHGRFPDVIKAFNSLRYLFGELEMLEALTKGDSTPSTGDEFTVQHTIDLFGGRDNG